MCLSKTIKEKLLQFISKSLAITPQLCPALENQCHCLSSVSHRYYPLRDSSSNILLSSYKGLHDSDYNHLSGYPLVITKDHPIFVNDIYEGIMQTLDIYYFTFIPTLQIRHRGWGREIIK